MKGLIGIILFLLFSSIGKSFGSSLDESSLMLSDKIFTHDIEVALPQSSVIIIDSEVTDNNPSYTVNNAELRIVDGGVFTVNDLTIQSNSSLVIDAGGVLIVNGNLTAMNKMTINTGGTLIVMGDFTHSGQGAHGSFESSDPSSVYILGKIDPPSLPEDNYPVLYCDEDIINDDDGLTDYTGSGCNYGNEEDLMIDTVFQAICGEGLNGGLIGFDQDICEGDVLAGFSSVLPAEPNIEGYQWYYTIIADSNPKTNLFDWNRIENANSIDYQYDMGSLKVTTYFCRQGIKGKGCVVYSNIVVVKVDPSPQPHGVFHD